MAYVATESCIGTLNQDCLAECPADCFYFVPGALFGRGVGFLRAGTDDGDSRPRPGMLMINPDECIDCGECETACPVEAIYEDRSVPEGSEQGYCQMSLMVALRRRASPASRRPRRRCPG
ncbi:4Fe-4S dicluster domain-containing protein [Tautonia rosea]|uniref:4Fe-4S dicluster domain-containing protein n=1 Tax=Tautonia rosea TaxID=2728037 RepID=UPI00147400CB|nr:ferredoxin family protein [Tautonia rosea]